MNGFKERDFTFFPSFLFKQIHYIRKIWLYGCLRSVRIEEEEEIQKF